MPQTPPDAQPAHPGDSSGGGPGHGADSSGHAAGSTTSTTTSTATGDGSRTPRTRPAEGNSSTSMPTGDPVPPRGAAAKKQPSTRNRASLGHRVRYALRNPSRVVPYLRRVVRDWLLRRATGDDHVAYYRAVMRADTAKNPYGAVGTPSEERWKALGEMQFTYLRSHGLLPSHRMLEIGCGNLRAGRHFINYLDTGNYYGIDISPDILLAAQRTLTEYGLRDKLPHLTLVDGLTFAHLPDDAFDVIHAHSVFSHSPLHVIDECFAHVTRVLAPGGFFDFTYNRTEGEEHQVLHEDFYYRPDTLVALAASRGLSARLMDDWDALPHKQSKIRLTVASEATKPDGEDEDEGEGEGEGGSNRARDV